MSDRKPRKDSALKLLPEDYQEEIIKWMRMPKTDSCPGGATHAREQLAADGHKVSERVLSDFWSWWHLGQRFEQMEARTEQFQEELQRVSTGLSAAQIREMGAKHFMLQAVTVDDPETFVAIDRANTYREKAYSDREKWQLDAARLAIEHAAEIKTIVANSAMTEKQKVEAVRFRLFGNAPAGGKTE